jgi:hypothetical protein
MFARITSGDKFGEIVLIKTSASDIQQPYVKLKSIRRGQAFQHGKRGWGSIGGYMRKESKISM